MTFSDPSVVDIIQLIFAIIAGCYALYLYRQSNKAKRNQFVIDVFDRLYSDNEIRKILYVVDLEKDTSEIKFGGLLEKEIDKTLRFLDFVGHLIKDGSIKTKDIEPFSYEVGRILQNENVVEYINWLKSIGVRLENLKYCPQQGFDLV